MQPPQGSSAPSLDSSGTVGSPRQWNLCFSPRFCLHTFASALWGWTCRELWTPWPEVPESTLGSYTGRPLQTPVPAAHTVAPQHYLCTQVPLCAQASASAHQQYGRVFLWIFQCRHQGAVPWLCDLHLLNGPRLIDSWTHQNIQSGFSCWFPIPSINRPQQFYPILLVVLSVPGTYHSFFLCLHSTFPHHSCPPISFPLIHILAILQGLAQIPLPLWSHVFLLIAITILSLLTKHACAM